MAVQTTYNETIDAARAGMRADMTPVVFASRTVEETAGIGFGIAVAQGTNDKGVHAFGSGDTEVLGISVRERSVRPETPNQFARYESARIMTKGTIWVMAANAVAAGDPVFVDPSDGSFTNAQDTAESLVQIANARWDTSTAGAALAVIRLG